MTVSTLMSELSRLDPNAEIIIDAAGCDMDNVKIDYVSAGDDGQVILTLE